MLKKRSNGTKKVPFGDTQFKIVPSAVSQKSNKKAALECPSRTAIRYVFYISFSFISLKFRLILNSSLALHLLFSESENFK